MSLAMETNMPKSSRYRGVWIGLCSVVLGQAGFYLSGFGGIALTIGKLIVGVSMVIALGALIIIYTEAYQNRSTGKGKPVDQKSEAPPEE